MLCVFPLWICGAKPIYAVYEPNIMVTLVFQTVQIKLSNSVYVDIELSGRWCMYVQAQESFGNIV